MSKIQGFILYRIWYGDVLVYLGRKTIIPKIKIILTYTK